MRVVRLVLPVHRNQNISIGVNCQPVPLGEVFNCEQFAVDGRFCSPPGGSCVDVTLQPRPRYRYHSVNCINPSPGAMYLDGVSTLSTINPTEIGSMKLHRYDNRLTSHLCPSDCCATSPSPRRCSIHRLSRFMMQRTRLLAPFKSPEVVYACRRIGKTRKGYVREISGSSKYGLVDNVHGGVGGLYDGGM